MCLTIYLQIENSRLQTRVLQKQMFYSNKTGLPKISGHLDKYAPLS